MKIYSKKRQGAIIVLFAVLLPLLIVILGFTIDFAYMQRTRNEVRVVSDLAAKAAIDTLARTGDTSAARSAARQVAANNLVAGEVVELTDDQILFGRSTLDIDSNYQFVEGDVPFNAVSVTAVRDSTKPGGAIPLFFGQFYGKTDFVAARNSQAYFQDSEIMLVLDRSGSMKLDVVNLATQQEEESRYCQLPVPTSRWMALDSAVTVFLQTLETTLPQERVGLVTFAGVQTRNCGGTEMQSDEVSLDSPLSSDLSLIRLQMQNRQNEIWFGSTNIRAGLEAARIHFQQNGAADSKKTIICLTDGVHNVGELPFAEAARCADAGITVHTITLSSDSNQTDMVTTAMNGGGYHFHAPDAASLTTIFQQLAASPSVLTR